jgi:arginyl-tRNA synthetase
MKIREIIREAIAEFALGKEFSVEHPADEKMGDYSTNLAMIMAKELGRNPRELALDLVVKLQGNKKLSDWVEKMEPAGPGFINFWIKKEVLVDECKKAVLNKDVYGKNDDLKGKLHEVEHTSPNPNKAMHIGHLRNNVTGMAIANLFEESGAKVIRDAVDNNRGIAIAKLMWGYLKFAKKDGKETNDINYWYEHQNEWQTPEDRKTRPDLFVDGLYVKGAEDFKNSTEVETRVRKMVVDWEANDKITWELWKKVLDYSYEGQKMTLDRLGSKWDKVWHESDHYAVGKEYVARGLKEGIFQKLDDGAVLTNLASFGLTDTILQKSDGTSLYMTQDLALTDLKKKTYQADKMFWVIGPEQTLNMKQMFAVCQQLGIGKIEDFVHVPYGYMSMKGMGKISSRTGQVVYIDQLIDLVKESLLEKIKDRDFSKEEKDSLAEKLAVGAVKYSILKMGRMTDMAFDIETSISFDGDSAPYLNYVYVRTQSVLAKAEKNMAEKEIDKVDLNMEELNLLRWIYRFSEKIEMATEELSPNLICSYLLELAQRFNVFYGNNKILSGSESDNFRLRLTEAVSIIIKNGLKLLGIETVEKM